VQLLVQREAPRPPPGMAPQLAALLRSCTALDPCARPSAEAVLKVS
jgi:hypothetical protein